jgi:uncharacterized protein YbjT (DUF2867 family)
MNRRVLVTGATGFTGSYVVPLLLRDNYHVRCLVRETSKTNVLPVKEVELVYGDLDDFTSLMRGLECMDVLVNIASLGFGHAPNIVKAAVTAGIQRAIFVSTTAVKTNLNVRSKSIRLAAEEAIRESGLAYTILRPTMIFGSSRDRNICRLVRYLNRWPVIPIFGDGESLQQPVYVADLAQAIVQALGSLNSIGKIYDISGAAPSTYNELIRTACALMDRKVRKIHLPAGPVVKALRAIEAVTRRLPIKAEQIERLNEDKSFDHRAAAQDFAYRPRSLREALTLELEEMGLLHVAGR